MEDMMNEFATAEEEKNQTEKELRREKKGKELNDIELNYIKQKYSGVPID